MLYNIEIKFEDGPVNQFQRKSNIIPKNDQKLVDKLWNEFDTNHQIKRLTLTPIY